MTLLQIAEPNQSQPPHQHHLAVGIDLGTTNSLVATVRSGIPDTLPDTQGRHLLPSIVSYTETGILVGELAKANAVSDPLNTIVSIKRMMGRDQQDLTKSGLQLPYELVASTNSNIPRIRTRFGDVTPVEVSAEILKVLSKRAEQTLGGALTGVVITVPAYFDDAQRQATKDAARLAGLRVFRLLNEPTAAAVAYGLDHQTDGVYAIYDLGGGTFDISILRLHRGVFEVLATAGDSVLGGDDLDLAIARWMTEHAGIAHDINHQDMRRLMRDACVAKETLSSQEQATIQVLRPNAELWIGNLDRKTFETLAEPILRRTLTPCRRALKDSGLRPEEIDKVVLVGGATRIPRVRALVTEFFGIQPLVDLDPDRIVAIGAAIQANTLAGNKSESESLLLDVIPLSLGLETMGGLVETIIPRNTTIPVARAQEFTTFKDGQTALALHVLQGERDLVQDCRSLARFELRNIPPMVAGAARIQVTFMVDADGLLSVTACEQTSKTQTQITVKPTYGLNDREIEIMLKEAVAHAQEDKEARQLKEAQVEATRVCEALKSALAEDGEQMLSSAEQDQLNQALADLIKSVSNTNAAHIRQAQQALEQRCSFYVERRMNAGINKAITGQQIEKFE